MMRRIEWAIQLTDPDTNRPMIRDHWTDSTRFGRASRPFNSYEDALSQVGLYQARYNPVVVQRVIKFDEGEWMPVRTREVPEFGYATTITHLLIVHESGQWFLDGRNEYDEYTEACWTYDSWDEAKADIPDFIRALTNDYGVTIKWRKKCNAMCAGGGYAFICTQWAYHNGHHKGRAISLLSHVVTGQEL
jgi:hypothetical protein